MSTTRQDAWTQDEDLLLAEVVLRHIREGGTQLQAFEEVGKRLSRTAAACGFRWNSYVRKQYKSGIELAKKQRKEVKRSPFEAKMDLVNMEHSEEISSKLEEIIIEPINNKDTEPTFEEILAYLTNLNEQANSAINHQETIREYKKKIATLEEQLETLLEQNEKLTKELSIIENDYKSLMDIMERARKMVVLKEEGSVREKLDK
jgi:prespore-specific regulator